MVTAKDLLLDEKLIDELIRSIRLQGDESAPIENFASLVWSTLCEPGDSFAGRLVSSFGAARALSFELAATTPEDYAHHFAESGNDWFEGLGSARFSRSLADARERWKPRLTLSNVKDAIDSTAALGGWFVSSYCKLWPSHFEDLGPHSPFGLWGLGQSDALNSLSHGISMVGSRAATAYGQQVAGDLLSELVPRGLAVVSGGAYGVDAIAHRATVALGGVTVAVMAGGLDRLYPSGNGELFREIQAKGAVVSELPPKTEPTKWRFLQRNRLIAALGKATLVIEAAPRSGAISTANRAIELERPLGAVPGPINSPGSDGCHRLIREGSATLITCGEDVLELLGESDWRAQVEAGLGPLETRVLDVIGFGAATVEVICSQAGLTRNEAELGVGGLSLAGLISQTERGWQQVT